MPAASSFESSLPSPAPPNSFDLGELSSPHHADSLQAPASLQKTNSFGNSFGKSSQPKSSTTSFDFGVSSAANGLDRGDHSPPPVSPSGGYTLEAASFSSFELGEPTKIDFGGGSSSALHTLSYGSPIKFNFESPTLVNSKEGSSPNEKGFRL